jgi:hypothetical protein
MRGGGRETLGVPGSEGPAAAAGWRPARCGAPPAAGVRPSIVARPQAAVRRIGPRDRRDGPAPAMAHWVPRPVSADRLAHASDLRGARVALQVGIACPAGDLWASVRFAERAIVQVFGLCIGITHQSNVSSGGAGSGGGTSRSGNVAPQSRHCPRPTRDIHFAELGSLIIRTDGLPHRGLGQCKPLKSSRSSLLKLSTYRAMGYPSESVRARRRRRGGSCCSIQPG